LRFRIKSRHRGVPSQNWVDVPLVLL